MFLWQTIAEAGAQPSPLPAHGVCGLRLIYRQYTTRNVIRRSWWEELLDGTHLVNSGCIVEPPLFDSKPHLAAACL
jgi:hypothetical protein